MGCFERTACMLSIVKQITNPGACMRQVLGPGALGRPRGIGWGGRWEGRIGMGNTCNSMADSCQCMTKPTEML